MALAGLKRLLTKSGAPTARAPEGLRVYAVGDIHGRADLLTQLASMIEAEVADAPGKAVTVFLGDYLDRGPDSAAVIERLASNDFPTPFRALRGNHEEVALQFLQDESVLGEWRRFGGLETLHSYGVNIAQPMRGLGFDKAREDFADRLPGAHRDFLQRTELTATYGDYFFCHAGVRPGAPFARQTAEDLLWIREPFLSYQGVFEKVVVHGHTPVAAPESLPNRINVDTGAFATSMLTTVVLEGGARRFLFARNG